MTVLFDISHAGHVHFFRNSIRMMNEQSLNYIVVAKEKDSVNNLLHSFEIPFISIPKYRSNLDKFLKIPKITSMIRRIIDKYNVKKVFGIHPVHGSLASKGKEVECIGFADSEHMIEQMAFFWPSCDKIYTSNAFKFSFGKKQNRYRGYHELAYLHPKYFQPSRSGIEQFGLFDNGPPIVYRMINWDATHDFSIHKEREKEINFLLELEKSYPIILSVEGDVPSQVAHLAKPFPKSRLHDILAEGLLYIGAGATTAIESTTLGTPALYTNTLNAGILDLLEKETTMFQRFNIDFEDPDFIKDQIDEIVSLNHKHSQKRLLANTIDVKELIDSLILN